MDAIDLAADTPGATVIRVALDLFSRVLTGQVEEVERVLRVYTLATRGEPLFSLAQVNAFGQAICSAKATLDLPGNGSHGIYNPAVHPAARLAYSLLRQAEGRDEEVDRALTAETDERWRAEYGEPWYGWPARRVAP